MSETPSRALAAENLRMTYRLGNSEVTVLDGIWLEVQRGERVAIAGPSGAGKSTLLHILGGLQRPTSGWVRVGEQDLYGMAASARATWRARSVGFIFQFFHLLPELDVLENVLLPAMAAGRPLRSSRERAMALLEAVGLQDRRRHTPLELSGGEQQRAAVARALMNDPDLVLADEPTGSLDSRTGRQVLDLLFDLTSAGRRTLLLVTHNEEIARQCGRIIRLRDGRIELDGRE
jgi:predicted ABC-type transport system involved in lysophospholipase L1 biosynthesis ATPase subunit